MLAMSSPQQGIGTRLRRYAPLIAAFTILGGCQANQADAPLPPRDNVSLFGVRIGMTPDQLNATLPGAHCAPITEHPTCQVPSTAMGSSGINVAFSDGRVTSAYTEGEMSGGIPNVSRLIAEQLGPSRERPFGGSYATTWTAKDESELALVQGHEITAPHANSYPAEYTLSLSSPASRKQRAQELDAAEQKIERDLTKTLGQVFAIDPAGHVSICGIRVGATFEGKQGCPPSAHAELLPSPRHTEFPTSFELSADTPSGGCSAMLGPHLLENPFSGTHGLAVEAPTAKVCVRVTADATTRQVTGVSATIARHAADGRTVDSAFMALPNASQLKPSPNDFIASPAWQYENAIGDVVTFEMDGGKLGISGDRKNGNLLTVSIAGRTADASFN